MSRGSRPSVAPAPARTKRGPKPKPVLERPAPLWETWVDPPGFAEALDLQMRRFGDTPHHLERVFNASPDRPDKTTFRVWRRDEKLPQTAASLRVLAALAERYGLPRDYFQAKLAPSGKVVGGHRRLKVAEAERRRIAWHLPTDFDERPAREREEILAWVRTVIISGATDYRRYQAEALKRRYGLQFSIAPKPGRRPARPGATGGLHDAPPRLAAEMADLVHFKTRVLAAAGYHRSGVWGPETAAQRAEHLGLLFGALSAAPDGEIRGRGVAREHLTFALLVFPAVWDWYLSWREGRRGFFTAWETDMLQLAAALTRRDTGWLRQSPALAEQLTELPGLVTANQIAAARADWDGACDALHSHALTRIKEVGRVARIHRDPFEPILPILEADSPLQEYRRITDEIARRMPDARRHPKPAAEAARAFLMLRFGLHLGVRQKNLRQLLFRPRGGAPTSERRLETLKRGELRWSARDQAWEVLIPAAAFKNSGSSYFANKPYRVLLPDLAGLYEMIEAYLERHRARLLGEAADPGTFFVKTAKITSRDAAYEASSFYEAWRLAIQRYGIFNPYTGKGAIPGLLPHGPHNVRDVLATHILKQTGSYEQASYAIQDTVETVANHYGRFLPQDKAALAAQVLNEVWRTPLDCDEGGSSLASPDTPRHASRLAR